MDDLNVEFYLHRDCVSDVRGKELKHLQVAAQETHGIDAGVNLSVGVFIAEGVHDVHHNGRGERHGVGLPVRGFAHLVSVHCAVRDREFV